MKTESQKKLAGWMNKDELTWGDMAEMFPLFGKMIDEISDMNYFRKQGLAEIEDSLNDMLLQLNGLGSKLVAVTDKLHNEIEIWWSEGDKKFDDFCDKRDKLQKKFDSVPEIEIKDFMIPYSLNTAIDIAERLSNLDDRTINILLQLMDKKGDKR